MQKPFHPLFRSGGTIAVVALALASARLSAAENSDALPVFESYIKISGHAADIAGTKSSYQTRTKEPKSGAGIEELYLTKELNKTTSYVIEGRALAGAEDYLGTYRLTKNEVGSFEIGYKRFRTFYDGVGGFFPVTRSFVALNPRDLHIDRGEFWAEVKIARPNEPVFTLRYTNTTRNGQKDSISWGDTDNSGQVYRSLNDGLGVNNNATVRKNMPSSFDIDERKETLEGSIKHKVGNTTAQLSLIGDWARKNNTHLVSRFPGETLGVLPGATVISAPVAEVTAATNWLAFNNQIDQKTKEKQDTETKSAIFTSVTKLSPQLNLHLGALYQDVSADSSGDRMTITNAPIVGDLRRTLTAFPVQNLVGKADVEVWSGKIGLDYKPNSNFTATIAVSDEDRSANGSGSYDVVTASTAAVPVYTTTGRLEKSVVDENTMTPALDLRYTGIKDLSLYLSVSKKIIDGTDVQTPAYNTTTTTSPSVIYRDVTGDKWDYKVGGNWRIQPNLTVRGETFYRDHSFQTQGWNTNTNDPANPTLGNNYELDSQFYGLKLSTVVKPLPVLSVTARYIYEKGKMQVTGFLPLYPEYDSMDSKTHNIGVTVDWNPTKQFYLQGNVDLVYNVISTAFLHDLSVAAVGVIPANRIIQNSDNNYRTASLIAGTALTKVDDLQVQCTYYKADNYNPLLARYTQPYGASAKESSVQVGLKHKFSDKWIGHAKMGYIDHQNDTTGGFTNFRGPLAYVALEYGL